MPSEQPGAAGPRHIAYVISSHGFGHAARAAAVIAAFVRQRPDCPPGGTKGGRHCRFTLFTTVPAWFFESSLAGSTFEIESFDTDLGLVQTDALTEDLAATLTQLRRRIPFPDTEVDALARRLEACGADLVLCDIAPLGLVAARRAGRPAWLVENFTWDFIYRGYVDDCPELAPIADALEQVFAAADRRIQTEPFCQPFDGAHQVGPVSRSPRTPRAEVRRRLGVPDGAALVLITMGGVDWNYDDLAAELRAADDPWLVIPGSRQRERHGRVIRLPHHSEFFHPDLIQAADVVVGKLGYSTLAEVCRVGVPFAFLTRPRFPESAVLEAWTRQKLASTRLEVDELTNGRWLDRVRGLLGAPRRADPRDGAEEILRIVSAARVHNRPRG